MEIITNEEREKTRKELKEKILTFEGLAVYFREKGSKYCVNGRNYAFECYDEAEDMDKLASKLKRQYEALYGEFKYGVEE